MDQPQAEEQAAGTPQPEQEEEVALDTPKVVKGALFPHEIPTPHWDVDFGDNKQTYEGSDLPIWILAGWAIFILWGIIYLVAGLPTAF